MKHIITFLYWLHSTGFLALLIDLRVGPNDVAVVAVQPLGNSDASNTLSLLCFSTIDTLHKIMYMNLKYVNEIIEDTYESKQKKQIDYLCFFKILK